MLNWLSKFFKNEEQEAVFIASQNIEIIFALKYKDLEIGRLEEKNGQWIFKYSEAFKNQNKIDALVDFPNKDKVYNSPYLWSFFAHRIPGLGQPQVKDIIEKEKLNASSEADLLRRFGRKSIANPFELATL